MPPTTPKVGDVKSKTGGTTTFYTKRDFDPNIPKSNRNVAPAPGVTPPVPTAVAGTVPASTLASSGQTPSVNLPPPAQLPEVANDAKSFGQSYLSNLQAEAQQRLDQAQAPITESENAIREAMGMVGQKGQVRTELEDQAGINRLSQQMRQAEQSIANQIAEIDDFDDMTAFNDEQMRQDASKRDMTKRTFGAQSAEFNLQRSLERRGKAAELRATVAANAALQGNFELATEQVDKALAAIYDPIETGLKMEQFFLERNDKRFDAAQKEVADLRKTEIERQFVDIDRARSLSDMAVASGYATAEDIKTITSMSGNPQEQAEFAQGIVAKAARAKVAQAQAELAAKQSAAQAELVKAGLGELRAFANTVEQTDKTVSTIDRITNLRLGIKASTGLVQSPLATAFAGKQLEGNKNLFRFTPVVGNALAYKQAATEKMNLLSDLSYLTNDATFREMISLKQDGVTFGALTEGERKAIGRAADNLFSALSVDDTGAVTGISLSEDQFRSRIEEYKLQVLKYQEEASKVQAGTTMSDLLLIDSL